MEQTNNTGFSPESLRLIGAALALQHVERTAASITPIPSTGRFVVIGTPAEVARLLEIGPATTTPSLPLSAEQLEPLLKHWFGLEDCKGLFNPERLLAFSNALIAQARTAQQEDVFKPCTSNGVECKNLENMNINVQQATASRGEPSERAAMFRAFSECLVHGKDMTPQEIADKLLAARASHGAQAPDDGQDSIQRENALFTEWWRRNQECPEHSLVTENAAHAAWQARAAISNRASSAKVEGTWEPMGKFAERFVPAATPASDTRAAVALTVWEGPMPESNGSQNYTAVLHRKDSEGLDRFTDGFQFACSEYPDRTRYDADFMRWLIGERDIQPDPLDDCYDMDKHSGYAAPTAAIAEADAKDPARAVCTVPPPGWYCTRERGHDGPCAAHPAHVAHDLSEGGRHD